MASSGNFSTMNPLHRTSTNVQYSNGNMTFSPNSSWSETTFTRNNMVIPKDKKIYFEVYYKTQSGYYAMHGLSAVNAIPTSSQSGSTGTILIYNDSTRINGTRTDGVVTAASQGDVIGIAIDGSNNKVWFAVNNTWQISGDPANGTNEIGTITTNNTVGHDITAAFNQNSVSSLTVNFGQDSTFGGDVTAGGNADANGFGDFKYAPPTGFLALCSGNLSVSADIDPAQTDDDYPSKQFNAVLYTGNGSSNAITGLGFQPDLVWAKMRSSSQANILIDSSRGQGLLFSSLANAEQTSNGPFMTSYDSDGFTLASSGSNPNDSGRTYVAWCWRANGGTTASDTSGDINSTTQANTKAGFSIVTYTGNGSSAQSIGHGLSSKAPELIFVKNRDAADSWAVYHHSLGNSTHAILDTNAAPTTSSAYWGSFTPTTTLFKVGSDHKLNASGEDYVAYLWHGVEGYSKFGTYEGNGNNDGPFIYMGFRPRLVCIKAVDSNQAWYVTDTERETFNPLGEKMLSWNDSHAEFDPSGFNFDVVSNGIKIRSSDTNINSSATFIYMAWGDVPFKYNNTF